MGKFEWCLRCRTPLERWLREGAPPVTGSLCTLRQLGSMVEKRTDMCADRTPSWPAGTAVDCSHEAAPEYQDARGALEIPIDRECSARRVRRRSSKSTALGRQHTQTHSPLEVEMAMKSACAAGLTPHRGVEPRPFRSCQRTGRGREGRATTWARKSCCCCGCCC